MHQRHVVSQKANVDGTNGDNHQPQSKRKKKRRRSKSASWQLVLGLSMIGMVALLLWKALDGVSFHWEATSGTLTKFEKYSEQAPVCSHLSSVEQISFTLVTQLSYDRLWMMEHHCKRYQYEMSIAIFTNFTYEETLLELESMNCDLNLVKVQTLDASRFSSSDYPVNQLRNMALSQVRTSHILYIDVDFWTSEYLHEILSLEDIRLALLQNPTLALVIPAFMLFRQCREYKECPEANIPNMPFTQSELVNMLNNRKGFIFDASNKGGHGSTQYAKYFNQTYGTLLSIDCLKSNRYEPFLVVRYCHDLPPFQQSFSGYGKNKLTWMMQLIRRGYTLSQVGGAFLCHYPHLESSARQAWNEAPQKLQVGDKLRRPSISDGNLNLALYKRGQVDQIFVEFRNWLETAIPDQRKIPFCEEAQDDDAKLWIERDSEATEKL